MREAVHQLVSENWPAQPARVAGASYRAPATALRFDVDRYNRVFYERCWQAASLLTMPQVRPSAAALAGLQVEIGCGLRPRLPLAEGLFVDVSPSACTKLQRAGARVIRARAEALPFASGAVAQLYLFDILEHVSDDEAVARELARVSAANGRLILSTPLHRHRWQEFDRVVGHARRYEPRALVDLLCGYGFALEGFARFGMRPHSAWLTSLAAYWMTHWPRAAFRLQEWTLRRMQRRVPAAQLQWAGVDEFLEQVADADGAVTAWRHQGAA